MYLLTKDIRQPGILGRFKKKISLREYYHTRHWDRIKKRKKAQVKKRKGQVVCEYKNCDMTFGLEVHHVTYRDGTGRKVFFRERMNQLQLLCHKHHMMHHRIHK